MPEFTFRSKRLHYLTEGRGDLLVVLPGNTACAAAHAAQLSVFARQFQAVALDFLGSGRSARDAPPDDWWAAGPEQVMALLDHLERDTTTLVGTSGGAVVALRAAAAHPERVAAVIADSFSARFDREMLRRNVLEPRRDPPEEQREFWRFCHGEDWRAVVDADTGTIERLVDRGGDWLDVDLGRIRGPVLLTGSAADPTIPDIRSDYRSLAGRMTDARTLLVDEGGHPLMWTRPELFHREALSFLAEAVARG